MITSPSAFSPKGVVSLKGGRYKGEFSEYELQNSLFLCPSHFTLFERGLVRIPSIEDGEMSPGARAAAIRKLGNSLDEILKGST